MLMRAYVHLSAIASHHLHHKTALGSRFLAELDGTGWKGEGVSQVRKLLTSYWATPRVKAETAWRHVGLIAGMKRHDPPPWLRNPAPDAALARTAEVARQPLETILENGLLTALGLALEMTPVTVLRDQQVFRGSPKGPGSGPFLKANSFERLRPVFDAATTAAGIP